jgi:hypothetical protein
MATSPARQVARIGSFRTYYRAWRLYGVPRRDAARLARHDLRTDRMERLQRRYERRGARTAEQLSAGVLDHVRAPSEGFSSPDLQVVIRIVDTNVDTKLKAIAQAATRRRTPSGRSGGSL